MAKRYTYAEVKHFIEVESESRCKLLSNEYKNVKTYMLFKCECGIDFKTTFEQFKDRNKRQCNNCGMQTTWNKLRLSYEEVKKFIEVISKSNCKLLSTEYINNSSDMIFLCSCGEEFVTTFNNFSNHNKRQCNKCSKKYRYDKDTYREKIHELYQNEYTVLGDYINANTPILIKHNDCDFQWFVTPCEIIRRNICPSCNKSIGEKRIVKYLKINKINYKEQYTFDDCRNKFLLPFDFYLPEYNLLIEYDGEQHYKPIDFFGGRERFEYQQQNDNIKNNYCKQNNIRLIRIPYWDFSNLEDILQHEISEVISNGQ